MPTLLENPPTIAVNGNPAPLQRSTRHAAPSLVLAVKRAIAAFEVLVDQINDAGTVEEREVAEAAFQKALDGGKSADSEME